MPKFLNDIEEKGSDLEVKYIQRTEKWSHTHTYAISGEIKVPSGDTDFIAPFFLVSLTGETVRFIKCRHKINSGTSATVSVKRNGSDVTGYTGISVTTTAANTNSADVTISDEDSMSIVVTGVSGTPTHMTFSLFFEHEITG